MEIDFGKDAAHPSGAPEAGGATTPGSQFGGLRFEAHLWRMLARWAREVEAFAYRRLRDLEAHSDHKGGPGSPRRVKQAFRHH
jgi:hypothetical protein